MAERAAEISELKKKLRHASRAPGRQVDATELAQLRRDAKDAQRELATLRESLQRPSFQRALDDLRRTVVTLRSVDREKAHPLRQLPFKLRNYRLAMSHGIAVPEIYGTWAKVDDIDFTLLPHEFVLKSDGGAGGHGVLPLRRRAHRQFELISTDTVLSEDDVRRRIREAKSLSGPYFAEELLGAPESTGLPEDVKIFAFYGAIGQVLLRRVPEHANLQSMRFRFVDERGSDLRDGVRDRRLDSSIETPRDFKEMIEVARHLSVAVGVPFVRVDLYQTSRGVVLGELTRGPGGNPGYSPAHDEYMGRLYEEARWRLERDLMTGRVPGIVHGSFEAPNFYPAGHVSQQHDPGTWSVAHGSCDWCRR